jgi:hypothetical protein
MSSISPVALMMCGGGPLNSVEVFCSVVVVLILVSFVSLVSFSL